MSQIDIQAEVEEILRSYDFSAPEATAARLRDLWLRFEPKSIEGIKAEQRALQETVGIPVPVLRDIAKAITKPARQRVPDYLPLLRLLWDAYGREGRVVALIPLGALELKAPDVIVPLLRELCLTCLTWEDADRLAMDALEPIVRKQPEAWLPAVESWLDDSNKWVQRAAVTVLGRLAMKDARYTRRALQGAERLLLAEDHDVRRAVSFAIRLAARGEVGPVVDFLARQVPPADPAATWVLCDVIRSMAAKLLPEFVSLLPAYEQWGADETLSATDRRSIASAVKKLQDAQAGG
ncbi:MAG: DNA alkylation repair protein [Anaerolineae bacterium]|nr:DNA alkylation repair protein [Anaerolineae bacterium]